MELRVACSGRSEVYVCMSHRRHWGCELQLLTLCFVFDRGQVVATLCVTLNVREYVYIPVCCPLLGLVS